MKLSGSIVTCLMVSTAIKIGSTEAESEFSESEFSESEKSESEKSESTELEKMALRINGGEDFDDNLFVFMVSVQIKKKDETNPMHVCGGTLVTTQHVITAANCVDAQSLQGNELYVLVGTKVLSRSKTAPAELIKVVKTTIQPNYNRETRRNDLAVLRLEKVIKESPSVGVADLLMIDYYPAGMSCAILGWGATTPSGTGPLEDRLKIVIVRLISYQDCRTDLVDVKLHVSNVCTEGGSRTVCNGDDGGPLICYPNGFTLASGIMGVISGTQYPCGSLPAIYTRTSYKSTLDFIKMETGIRSLRNFDQGGC